MPIAVAWLRGWCDSCWHRQAVPREAARRGSDGTGPTVAGSGGVHAGVPGSAGHFQERTGTRPSVAPVQGPPLASDGLSLVP